MKKYRVTIFLSLLLVFSFVNANKLSIQKIDSYSSITAKSTTCFNTNCSYPNSEIECVNIYSQPVSNSHQGFQKTFDCVTINTKDLAGSSPFSSSGAYTRIELFGNNNLSHNYPSHNFW